MDCPPADRSGCALHRHRAVNLLVDTLAVGPTLALAGLTVYLASLCAAAVAVDARNITLKWW